MERWCKFLSFNLCEWWLDLFQCPSPAASASNQIMEGFSYNIRYQYPKDLVTYDAEELGEVRLIRFHDLTKSVMELILPTCQKKSKREEEDDCKLEFMDERLKKKNRCQSNKLKHETRMCETESISTGEQSTGKEDSETLCQFLKSLFPDERLNESRLNKLEQFSKMLHKRFVEGQTKEDYDSSKIPNNWESLKPMQKFCFYWQALTGHILHPTPYENFKDVFTRRYRRKCPNGALGQLRSLVKRCWGRLEPQERVPFNVNALLYHVSTGEVDPYDQCTMRAFLNRWK